MLNQLKELHDKIKGWRTVIWNMVIGLLSILPLSPSVAGPKWFWAILIINILGNILLRYLTKGPMGDKECHKECSKT